MIRLWISFVAILTVATALSTTSSLGDQVTSLPGLSAPLPSKTYAGYVPVDNTTGRSLFYMFVESQRDPTTDPIALWLTGGPGCSSLYALLAEHGPFQMNFTAAGAGIQLNPFAWNMVANVIYLESPAGVGFSYSNTTADYTTGDERTADDSYQFLLGFFERFPQFRPNSFWVTGESYGGHYVPELVSTILSRNPRVPPTQHINLVGMMAGNPWTDPEAEAFGVVDNWWQRAIISEQVFLDINAYCTYRDITFWIVNNVTMTLSSSAVPPPPVHANSTKCFQALTEGSLVQFGSVDILGIYVDVCVNGTNGAIPDQPNYCAAGEMQTYLNRLDVQQAIHVRNPPYSWNACSSVVVYNQTDTQTSVLPLYKEFIETSNLRILVYSGDNDAIVPTTGTRRWLRLLNRTIVSDTHQWFANTNGAQVGGWAIEYDRLTFTTVRGAGHMVPYMQPQRALHMFRTFIEGGVL